MCENCGYIRLTGHEQTFRSRRKGDHHTWAEQYKENCGNYKIGPC